MAAFCLPQGRSWQRRPLGYRAATVMERVGANPPARGSEGVGLATAVHFGRLSVAIGNCRLRPGVIQVCRFSSSEIHGLVHQMRRAAASIPGNIAEGFSRRGKIDKARFMKIAESSPEESR
jgi:hypothetical protein